MSPTIGHERIDAVDILRGVALWGILAANMRGLDGPPQAYFSSDALFKDPVSAGTMAVTFLFIQGKFVTLFSILFGLGFAIQMQRAQDRGGSIGFYPRRLLVLASIGFAHAFLVWWGDILIVYAAIGFLLLAFRNCRPRTIAIWTIAWSLTTLIPLPGGVGEKQLTPEMQVAMKHSIEVFGHGPYLQRVHENINVWLEFMRLPLGALFFIPPRFLLGLWIWKVGLIQNLAANVPILRKAWKWSLVSGLVFDALMAIVQAVLLPRHLLPGPVAAGLTGFLANLAMFGLSTFYGSLILLGTQNARWLPRLRPFGAVGRMALTNYLMQSIVCTWFFYVTGLYAKVPPLIGFTPVFVLYGSQILFSVWWLRNYRFGPMEWVWRSLTYGKWQPMSRPPQREITAAAEA